MGRSIYTFMLDLHSKKGQVALPVTQGDTNRELRISFSDGVRPYVLGAGSYAMLSIVRPTGTEVQEYCKIDEDGATVVYPFSDLTCAVAGLHTCEVVLYNAEGKQIASPRFSIDAAPKLILGDDVILPDEDVTVIDEMFRNEAQRQGAEVERVNAERERKIAEAEREANTRVAINEINEVKASIETMRDNGEFDGADGHSPTITLSPITGGNRMSVTDIDGSKSIDILNGASGADGVSAFHEWNGTTLTMHSAAGTSSMNLKGQKGDKGDRGEGIDIVGSYSSVADMMMGFATDGIPVGKFVVISTGNVNDEENARLYVKTETEYMYLTDLSGAQGIKGEKGEPGETGQQGVGISSINKTGTTGLTDRYTITFTDGTKTEFNVNNGKDGEQGDKGDPGEKGATGNGIADVRIVNGELQMVYTNGTNINLGNIMGKSYVLTEADKTEIANILFASIPNAESSEF